MRPIEHFPVEPNLLIIAYLSVYPDRKNIQSVTPIKLNLFGVSGTRERIVQECGGKIAHKYHEESPMLHCSFLKEAHHGTYFDTLRTIVKWFEMPELKAIVDEIYDKIDTFTKELKQSGIGVYKSIIEGEEFWGKPKST